MSSWAPRPPSPSSLGLTLSPSAPQVSVAVGCATRNRTVPFCSTFGAFFTRTFDQIRMAAISGSSINFCGSHCGVSIGELNGARRLAPVTSPGFWTRRLGGWGRAGFHSMGEGLTSAVSCPVPQGKMGPLRWLWKTWPCSGQSPLQRSFTQVTGCLQRRRWN